MPKRNEQVLLNECSVQLIELEGVLARMRQHLTAIIAVSEQRFLEGQHPLVGAALPSLTLSTLELRELTGYKASGRQLTELHRLGFSRSRRDGTGRVVLERAHYEAVCNGHMQPQRPRVIPPKLQPKKPAAIGRRAL